MSIAIYRHGEAWLIRDSRKEDASLLGEIASRAFESDLIGQKVAAAVTDFGGSLDPADVLLKSSVASQYIVCEHEGTGQIAGMCGHYRLRWTGPQNCYLGWFFIDPALQRHGLGSALFGETCSRAKGAGCRSILVETGAEPIETLNFYLAMDFKFLASVPDYWEDGSELILMRKAL